MSLKFEVRINWNERVVKIVVLGMYFNKDLFIIAARNENNCYVYPFNDMQINTQERIQFFYEHADYSNNWISLILLRDRINPLYATFYSHNHDYFYNAANKTGDL